MALLVDAGPLYAYMDRRDPDHAACAHLLKMHPGPLLVPILAVTEVSYLLRARGHADAEVHFLGDLAEGNLTIESVRAGDWLRIAELVMRYRNLDLGTVDASIVAVAERLGITTIATLDRRDFGTVRPSHVAAFELLP